MYVENVNTIFLTSIVIYCFELCDDEEAESASARDVECQA